MRGQPTPDECVPQSHPNRSTLRLREFDYTTPGAYFITICTFRKACVLGQVIDDHAFLSATGSMVASTWSDLPNCCPGVQTDAFIVMPNHIHGIIVLNGNHHTSPPADGQAWEPAPTFGLPDIIHRFKSLTTHQFAPLAHDRDHRPVRSHLWQRNYYEHVIRDDSGLQRIREYVANNPLSWALDRENPTLTAVPVRVAEPEPWQV